ncbi:MAG TPA: GTPase ObgE [Longimicrobiales bacterium]
MFVDYAVINVVAGTGGSGAEAFRREMGVPRGGPSGGNGGRGGSVYLQGDKQLSTLLDYQYQHMYRAERGEHGQGKSRFGKDGEDLVLRVPIGTVIRDADSGDLIGEIIEEGQLLLVAKAGRGGRGNEAFATPTRQAPTHWEPGEEGEERRIALELKLIADVGLVGKPNAGKSTFLAAISKATPKIADYPFTTLTPNLGVVQLSGHRTFVVADIPGIIEGAHEGKGLGLRFLRHIERTRTLAVLIAADADDPQGEYEVLMSELRSYSEELPEKPHCVIITKADLLPGDESPPVIAAPGAWGQYVVSSVARRGLDTLLEDLWTRVRREIESEQVYDELEEEYRP